MGDETDRTDRRVLNGSGYFGSGVRCKRPIQVDLRMNGKTHAIVVSDSVKDRKSAEDHPHGAAARDECRY